MPGSSNTVNMGGIVVGNSQNLLPTSVFVNGVPCALNTA
jgi:hypothetical protein